jgi:hypothetical protein
VAGGDSGVKVFVNNLVNPRPDELKKKKSNLISISYMSISNSLPQLSYLTKTKNYHQ